MLKRLEVANYRSLKDVVVGFKKFNVLVGLNASGKSNILDCFALLSESLTFFHNLSPLFDRRGSFQHVVFQGDDCGAPPHHPASPTRAYFTMKANFYDGHAYEYYLKCVKGNVEERWLKVNGNTLISEHQGSGKYLSKEGKEEKFTVSWKDLVNTVSNDFALRYMSKWRSYSFLTPQIRRTLPAKKRFVLEWDGSNLAQVLLSLKTERPKTFTAIEDILKLAIPEVEELLTPLTEEGQTYVAVREKGFRDAFDYHQLSDGTLRLLAYITALNLDADLLCFEEPENFVHPQLLRLLVEILKKSDKQAILSTHSPYFMDFVEPEDLIIVEKEEGKTKVRRIEEEEEKKRIKALLEEGIPLGEAYYSGAI